MKKYFIILLVLILPYISLSQIKIEERVEIAPQSIILPNNPDSGVEHIFTYTLTWTPGQYLRGNIRIITCSHDTLNSGPSTSGITTISVPANGSHQFLFEEQRWFYHNFLGWGWYQNLLPGRLLKVFLDETDLNHPQNMIGYGYGVYGYFNLNISGSICPADYANLSLRNIQPDECNSSLPNWHYTDPLYLQIIQGGNYVVLYNIVTGLELGSYVELAHYNELNNIKLRKKDTAPPVTSTQTITLEANINGVIATSDIELYSEIFEIYSWIYPDTVSTGEQVYIDLSISNYCERLPSEKRINVEIINGTEYGSLIDPNTGEKSKSLSNIEHWLGFLSFNYVADGISPEERDSVIIRVSTTDPNIPPKEVKLFLKPSPIYVYTTPDVLGADDTADVIIKHRLEDGTLEDFPPEQTFELAVLDGCVNGNFMVDDSINVYFADALPPIKFVTADSLDSEFGEVLIRVGTDIGGGGGAGRPVKGGNEEEIIVTEQRSGIDTLRAGFEKMIAEKRAEAEAKKKENNEPPIEATIVKACPPVGSNKEFNFNKNVSVGDECDEEIVVCNNPQLQNFDDVGVGVIERLIFNSPWSWTDPISGTTKNTDAGEGCNEGNPATDLGLTYVMDEIGTYSQNIPKVIYKLSEDIIVETCLNESDPNNSKWRFKVKNVRVPIFRDVCTKFISNRNFIDLGDATDISLLSAGIKNCRDLKLALVDIDWEISGGDYSFPCSPRAARYIFSAGIRVHEEKHFLDKSLYIRQKFNENTTRSINKIILNKEDYPCPVDALGPDNSGKTKRELFQLITSHYIMDGANINKHMGITSLYCPVFPFFYLQYKSELEASTFSIQTYTVIRERILTWGKAQSWYKPIQNLDCLGIN